MSRRPEDEQQAMRGFPPRPAQRVAMDQVHSAPWMTRWFVQHVRESARTADISSRRAPLIGLPREPRFMDRLNLSTSEGRIQTFAEFLETTSTDAIIVLLQGKIIYERYFGAMQPHRPHAYYSVSKAVASCVAARLVDRGLIDLKRPLVEYVPELAGSAYADASVRHLLDMTVGIHYVEDYEDDDTHDGRLQRLYGLKPRRAADEPGSTYDFATTVDKEGQHGDVFHYVSLNTNVLGWVMERATGLSVPDLIAIEVWGKLGGEHDAYITLDGAGSAQLEAGVASSLRDLARFGQMLCQDGLLAGEVVVPSWWIADTRACGDRRAFAASADADLLPGGSFRNCFWVSQHDDHTAFASLGKYGQMVYINQEAGVVIAKFSSQQRPSDDHLTSLTIESCEQLASIVSR